MFSPAINEFAGYSPWTCIYPTPGVWVMTLLALTFAWASLAHTPTILTYLGKYFDQFIPKITMGIQMSPLCCFWRLWQMSNEASNLTQSTGWNSVTGSHFKTHMEGPTCISIWKAHRNCYENKKTPKIGPHSSYSIEITYPPSFSILPCGHYSWSWRRMPLGNTGQCPVHSDTAITK